MANNLSQKEKMILEDQKKHEEICIQKYTKYASQAQDPQLKQLFNTYAGQEQQHLDTINQILSGQVPDMNQQGQQGQQGQQNQQGQQGQQNHQEQQSQQMSTQSTGDAATNNQNDAMLCSDLLMTEKYVSGTYDTAIFEFRDTNIRNALNHIQKEEQHHGEGIFNYMQSNGMYNVE